MPQTALITGASGGIGRALAVEFAQHGYDVVLVARDSGTLDAVAQTLSAAHSTITVHTIAADLAQPRAGRALLDQLVARGLQVDVLVNNAGFAMNGAFHQLPLAQQLEMLQLNVATLTELTGLLLPGMVARKRGGVLNVASTAAFQAGPLMSVYYATKAYVLSFTEGIAEELSDSGLKVSCLCPGPTDTGFAKRAAATETGLFKGGVMTADDVAREGFNGWSAGHVVVIPGRSNRRGTVFVRLAPRAKVRQIVKRLNSQAR